MLKGFEGIVDSVIQERSVEIGSKVVLNNTEYVKSEKEMAELINKIKTIIPKGNEQLVDSLNELIAYQEGVLQEIIYKQGLQDGTNLKNILNIAG
jgi:hypothetical protein